MIWGTVAASLQTLANADTGAGGLFYPSAPLILGFFTDEGYLAQPMPFVVASCVSITSIEVFTASQRTWEINFQLGVWTEKRLGEVNHQAIVSRLATVFNRQPLTSSGYVCSQLIPTGSPVWETQADALYSVHQYNGLFATNP